MTLKTEEYIAIAHEFDNISLSRNHYIDKFKWQACAQYVKSCSYNDSTYTYGSAASYGRCLLSILNTGLVDINEFIKEIEIIGKETEKI